MEIYKRHLSIKQNLPSFLLIKELYFNNKELLYNVDVITKMVKGITMIINHESKNTYRRCYLLETMKTFIHYNTEVIAENQNIIM